jgi:hypothetical protein
VIVGLAPVLIQKEQKIWVVVALNIFCLLCRLQRLSFFTGMCLGWPDDFVIIDTYASVWKCSKRLGYFCNFKTNAQSKQPLKRRIFFQICSPCFQVNPIRLLWRLVCTLLGDQKESICVCELGKRTIERQTAKKWIWKRRITKIGLTVLDRHEQQCLYSSSQLAVPLWIKLKVEYKF